MLSTDIKWQFNLNNMPNCYFCNFVIGEDKQKLTASIYTYSIFHGQDYIVDHQLPSIQFISETLPR